MVWIRAIQAPADMSDDLLTQAPVAPEDWVRPGSLGLLAVTKSGERAGAILLLPERQVAGTILAYKLAWIYVKESHRRQGVALTMLRAAASDAAAAGARCIQVPVRPRNAEAIALFEKLGPTRGVAYALHLTAGGA